MEKICEEQLCTGCTACVSICPTNAIQLKYNKFGFMVPDINQSKCVECAKCKNTCPICTPPKVFEKTKVYAYQNMNEQVRYNSTSGGFFRRVADYVLEQGGYVCGAGYNTHMELVHMITSDKNEISRLQKSKYVQSDLSGVFEQIKQLLDKEKLILFVGVPCQAAGLAKYLEKKYNNLILVDLVCYGVPSPGLFKEWINYLESKYGEVKNVVFRDKSYGYATPNIRVYNDNGGYVENNRDTNVFANLFFKNLTVRESCFNCQFKTVNRVSDITLGDLWLMEDYDKKLDDNKGTTAIFVHSDAGAELVDKICDNKILLNLNKIIETDAKKILERTKPSPKYTEFWEAYVESGFENLINMYEPENLKNKAKSCLKRVMNKTGISYFYFKSKKKRKIKFKQK